MSRNSQPILRLLPVAGFLLLIAACGGGGDGGTAANPAYAPSATVSGLVGSGLVLQDSLIDQLPISANGTFAFTTKLSTGTSSTFALSVLTQPINPSQTCTVTGGSGPIGPNFIASVTCVTNATNTYTVGGTVTVIGLPAGAAALFTLQLNSGNDVPLGGSGTFVFTGGLPSGSTYAVTVKAQTGVACTVVNGIGTIAATNVTNVAVSCPVNTYPVGGRVTGLVGSGLVLQINGGSDLPVVANGIFAFPTPWAYESTVTITVKSQPTSPSQTCKVNGGASAIATVFGSQTDIAVACGSAGRFAYVVNNGSNSISVYSIGSGGSFTPIGVPTATGAGPYGVAASPSGKFLAVNNETSNSISVYAIDSTTGALTAVQGSPFAAGTSPEALAFNPSGAYLYVANRGSNNVYVYTVNATTGGLAALGTPVAAGTAPQALAVDPSGKFIYVTNGTSGTISIFGINASTGALTLTSSVAAGTNPYSIAIGGAGTTKFVYVETGTTATSVLAYSVNSSSGALTALSGFPLSIAGINYLSTDRSGAFLFTLTQTGVRVYGIDTSSGALTNNFGTVTAGSNPHSVTVDPSNSSAYVANDGDGTVTGYFFNASNGALSITPGFPIGAGTFPDFIAIL